MIRALCVGYYVHNISNYIPIVLLSTDLYVHRYKVSSTISERVGRLNPSWTDPDQDTDVRLLPAQILSLMFYVVS